MTTHSRPRAPGVTLIALAFLLEAILALGMAAFLLLSASDSLGLNALFDRLRMPAALTSLLALLPLLTAGLAGMVFRGLWRRRDWARLAALVMAFLLVLAGLAALAFLYAFDVVSTASIVTVVALLALAAGALLYLLRVRFEEEEAATPPTPPDQPLAPPDQPFIERMPEPAPPRVQRGSQAASAGEWVPPPPRAPVVPPAYQAAETVASQPRTQQLAPAAWLVVRQGSELGRQIELYTHEPTILGRDPFRVNALINDPAVSGRHAEVRYEFNQFLLEDLNSTNGTFVDDRPIELHFLREGDEIRLGTTTLLFTGSRP